MIEKNKTDDVIAKRNELVSLVEKFQDIMSQIDDKIASIDGENDVFSSPASCYYVDYLKKDLIKTNDFLLTTKETVEFLTQCTDGYKAIDREIFNKLGQIGDVK